MAFGTATVVTNKGKAMFADRMQTTPATYTRPMRYIAMGRGATTAARTAAAADTALTTEVDTRTTGTESVVTSSVSGDTYQVTGTITAGGAETIDEAGLFDTSTTTAGNLGVSATFTGVALQTSDSIAFTWKVQVS
jgi:hypothetical protein